MFTRIFIFALVVGLVYLNYTTPKIEDHKAFLLAELQQQYPIPEAIQEQLWREIDYSNFMVCSFMKTTEGSTMISSGYLNKVKLIDTTWIDEVKTKLQRKSGAY